MKRAMLLCIALCLCTASALAAPSITELEQPRAVEINPASAADALWEALEGDTIYTSRALVEQYDGQLGSVIALAEETLEIPWRKGFHPYSRFLQAIRGKKTMKRPLI